MYKFVGLLAVAVCTVDSMATLRLKDVKEEMNIQSIIAELPEAAEYIQQFQDFIKEFERKYNPNQSEFKERLVYFMKNMKEMRDLQEKANQNDHSYQLGVTQFTDRSDAEKRAILSKERMTMDATTLNMTRVLGPKTRDSVNIDLSRDGCMSPIRDQGQCGSCWAFTAVNSVEFQYCKFNGHRWEFSEQSLVDCDGDSYGCNGGFVDKALLFTQSYGLSLANEYPYTARTENCRNVQRYSTTRKVYHLGGDRTEDRVYSCEYYLHKNGPITFSMSVPDAFFHYRGGVFSPNPNDCIPNQTAQGWHAMTVVGYGQEDNGRQFWIIRNSWGTGWGENGYLRMEKGRNLCHSEENFYVPVVHNAPDAF